MSLTESAAPPPGGPPDDAGPPSDVGPPGDRLRLAAYFLRYLRPVRGLVVLVIVVTLLGSVARLPMTFLPKVFTEHLGDAAYLWWYLAFVLGMTVFGWGLSFLLTYWGELLGELVVRALRHDIFSNLERLSMLSVYARGPGEFVQQIDRDVMMVRSLIASTLLNYGVELALGLTTFISMLVLDWALTLGLLAAFLILSLLVRWINRRVEHYSGRSRDVMLELLGKLVEYVGGFRDIVAAGRFRQFTAQFDDMLRRGQQLNVRTAVWGQLSGQVPATLVSLGVVTVYALGLSRSPGTAEVGALITYAILLGQLFPAMLAAARFTTDLAMATPSLQSLRDLLDQPPPAEKEAGVPLAGPVESIRFDRVSLELGGRPVLCDMTFDIPAGKFVAIVGQSGAGKTTLFHLLLRLLEPNAGAILVNGRPLTQYTLESLRQAIGFLPQNAFIFNQSLRDNILLATPQADVPAARLAQVIELAQLQPVLELRAAEGGLDAEAGYMGNRLSAGERQRLALARLLLRDPQVIVCDEYTANVDVKTAQLIHEAIRTQFAGRTRIVITHELASVRGADHIIVVDHGQVVQQGTHEELRAQPGLYRELMDVQTI
jgi:ABC-type multidrug transport system fused ATPase/permease subunit